MAARKKTAVPDFTKELKQEGLLQEPATPAKATKAEAPKPKGRRSSSGVPWEEDATPKAIGTASQEDAPAPKRRKSSEDAPPVKLPKLLGPCADLYFDLRTKRLAADAVAEELKRAENYVKEHLINQIPKSEATGVAGKLVRVSVVTKPKPRVENWDEFTTYIKKNNAFELLQRRINEAAVNERLADPKNKKGIPGMGTFDVVTLSCSKVK